MVRPLALVLVLLAASAGPARASEMPHPIGLFPKSGAPLPLVESKVDITVRGPIVEATITQRFKNPSDRATEATYIFPLPLDAAVSAMSIHMGNRTIHAAIERREDAQRRYEDAVRKGVAAAELDQERVDVFTQALAAIPARGEVAIVLRFDTVARFADGTWELALPLVVAPRYVPGTASGRGTTGSGRSPDTDRSPDASRVTPPASPGAGGPTQVAIHFADKPSDLTSPTHEVTLRGSDATFTDPRTDHDAIVRWKTSAPATGWIEPAPDGAYAAVVLTAPPAGPRKAGALRFLLVLDRSATSLGDAQAVARPTVRALLGALTAADRVAIAGSDAIAWAAPSDVARTLEPAWSRAAGAFDLTRVLAAAKPAGAPIVLVTGGLVADDAAAIAAAKRLGVPVHVIGVGPAPARGALTQIAGATGGTVRFAVAGDDLAALARAVVADAASAPAPLAVNWGTLAASDVVPAALPRLGSGQAILVLARVVRAPTANVRARGDLFAIEATPQPRPVEGATAPTPLGPLARRWARNRLDELLGTRAAATVVTAHAQRYGLVSPYTSLVAIGDEVIVNEGTRRSVAVPVSVPGGMKWQAVQRQTTVDVDDSAAHKPAEETITVTGSAPTIDQGATKQGTTIDKEEPKKEEPKKKAKKPERDEVDKDAARDAEGEGVVVDEDYTRNVPAARTFAGVLGAEPSAEVVAMSGVRHRWRFTTSVAGGFVRTGDLDNRLLVIGTRFEIGGRTLAGVDASLWFVDGTELIEGRTLFTVARRGLARWFELAGGFGVHFGEEGTGPAAGLALRFHVPPAPRLAPYLRYDAALLIDDAARNGQNTFTGGLELGF
jgi:Ca-activated chloride channel homolog